MLNWEDIIVFVVVGMAVLFLIRHFRRQVRPESSCKSGCAACKIDWHEIEKQARSQQGN